MRASRTVEPERQGGDEDHVPSTTVTVAPLLRVPTYASVANKHIQPKPHRSDVSKSTAVRLPPSGANSVQMNSGCEDDCDNTELGGRQHRTESAQYRNSLTASVTRGSGSSGKRDAKSYKGAVKDDSRAERVTATSSKKPPKGTKTSWSSAVDKHVGSGPLSNENPHVIPDAEVVFMDANSSGSRTQPAVANARNKDWQTPSKRKKARHASDHSWEQVVAPARGNASWSSIEFPGEGHQPNHDTVLHGTFSAITWAGTYEQLGELSEP